MTKRDNLLQNLLVRPMILGHFGADKIEYFQFSTNQPPQNAKVVPFCRLKNVAAQNAIKKLTHTWMVCASKLAANFPSDNRNSQKGSINN